MGKDTGEAQVPSAQSVCVPMQGPLGRALCPPPPHSHFHPRVDTLDLQPPVCLSLHKEEAFS